MIVRITGKLQEVTATAARVELDGGTWYEALVPAFDIERLSGRIGQQVVLHTIHFIEGDPSRGGITPRLVGFASEDDRDFFTRFITVKGVGIRKALRALARPVAEVAAGIQAKDAAFLTALPDIGKRTAEQIIAELHGKIDEFAGPAAETSPPAELSEPASEALAVLVQLGEKRADAAALIERVLSVAPDMDSPDQIIEKAYRLKAGTG